MILLCISLAQARTFSGSATINAGRFEDFYLRLVTSEQEINVEPGETVEFNVYIRRGPSDDAIHNLILTPGDNQYQLTLTPDTIAELRNIDMIKIKAQLTAPVDIEDGLYTLKIKVKSDDFVEETYPMKTKIRVGGYSNIPNYIFTLSSFGLVGVLIYRKRRIFGR